MQGCSSTSQDPSRVCSVRSHFHALHLRTYRDPNCALTDARAAGAVHDSLDPSVVVHVMAHAVKASHGMALGADLDAEDSRRLMDDMQEVSAALARMALDADVAGGQARLQRVVRTSRHCMQALLRLQKPSWRSRARVLSQALQRKKPPCGLEA